MNTRMERLVSHEDYHSGPAEARRPVDVRHLRIADAAVAEALGRILADIARAKGGAK